MNCSYSGIENSSSISCLRKYPSYFLRKYNYPILAPNIPWRYLEFRWRILMLLCRRASYCRVQNAHELWVFLLLLPSCRLKNRRGEPCCRCPEGMRITHYRLSPAQACLDILHLQYSLWPDAVLVPPALQRGAVQSCSVHITQDLRQI